MKQSISVDNCQVKTTNRYKSVLIEQPHDDNNSKYREEFDRIFSRLIKKSVEAEKLECTCDGELITFNEITKQFEACEACNPRKNCTHCSGTGIRMISYERNEALPYCICDDTQAKVDKLNAAGFTKTILKDENFTHKKPAPFYHPEQVDSNTARKAIQDFDESDKKLLIVVGDSLVGKTTQVSYLVRDFILNKNKSARIINLEEIYDAIDARDRNYPINKIIADYLYPELLVIDGVDREQVRRYKFKSLIMKRLEDGKRTVITTTIPENKFADFGETINKRIENFAIISRLSKQEAKEKYFIEKGKIVAKGTL